MYKAAKWKIIPVILMVLMLVSGLVAGCSTVPPPDESALIPTRSESPEKLTWDLTEFYETREAFDGDIALIKEKYMPALADYQGKLNTAANLLALFEMETEAALILDNVYVYSNLLADLDQTSTEATEMADIASGIYTEFYSTIAFVEPEILSLDEAVIRSFMDDPDMATYRYNLQTLLDRKEHILSEKEEQILAEVSEIFSAPEDIFSKAQYADFTFPTFTDKDGGEITLDWAAYDAIMLDPDREYRKKAYDTMWEAFKGTNYTMAATYMTEVKINTAMAKIRKYESALDAALASEDIPRSIYDNLLEATNNNLDYLHKYYGVYKNTLGLEELHGYDMGQPLVEDYDMALPYDEAVRMITAALEPLGDDYVADFTNGINSRWVDVYPDEHKYTGGYMWGTYTSHPYILMNYDNSVDWALGLAHEMGHAINSLYSNREQDYWNASYTIFTAEVASTTNEMLVTDYLIKNAASDDEKLYLLLEEINKISGTFYTQVMYSEFEQAAHAKAEAGEPLSAEALNNLYLELIRKYRGPDYTVDEIAGVGWSRIPHFYSEFYVYKYATSIAAARQIADDILAGKEGALDRYLTFLAAGGSDYSVELLKNAGVDMNSPAPVDNLLAYFGELVDEADRLLQERN